MDRKHPVMPLFLRNSGHFFSCAIFALGFDWCVAPNQFSIGGMTGIAQIINALSFLCCPWVC